MEQNWTSSHSDWDTRCDVVDTIYDVAKRLFRHREPPRGDDCCDTDAVICVCDSADGEPAREYD